MESNQNFQEGDIFSNKDFSLTEGVEKSCYKPIKERFKVLLDTKKLIQQDVADALFFDKAYISRIFNGIEIPPHHVRLKISSFFGVDSSTIWRVEDLPYIKERIRRDHHE